jgi:hypothetical protein
MKKLIAKASLLTFLVISTYAIFLIIVPTDPNHFLACLNDKHDAMNNSKKKRIIIVGGSSTLFGIDCTLIEKSFPEYDAINMGLDARFGLEFMINDIRNELREGDIIIIAAEYHHYHGAFNGKGILNNLIKQNVHYSKSLSYANIRIMLQGFPEFLRGQITKYLKTLTGKLKNPGVYRRNNINENGDIISYPENFKVKVKLIKFTSIEPIDQTAISFLNKFKKETDKKGVEVYISSPPLFNKQYEEGKKQIEYTVNNIGQKCNIKLITKSDEYAFDEELLYDTIYHLNRKGRAISTKKLIRDLKLAREFAR